MKIIKEHSAGGVVYRKRQSQVLWLVSKHSGYHKWVLPKGIVEEGETGEEAATREVFEETGIKAEIVQKINFEVKYKYKKPGLKDYRITGLTEDAILVDKTVEFYLMKYVSGDIKDHSWEMEEAKWAEYEKAMNWLGFEGEKEILKRAISLISD